MAMNDTSADLISPVKPQEHAGPYNDPAYKKLSRINGDINKMTKEQMKEKLANLHLDTRGQKDVLKKRLKSYFKRKYITRPGIAGPRQPHYSYYIVIDFEATCDENSHNYPHEIIEFPAVLVDAADGTVADEFHSFVRPTGNSHLTEFCKTLTNISQEQVNAAATFPDVLRDMEKWMKSHRLGKDNRFALVTDGPWDMSRFLYMQCTQSGIVYPRWACRWVNIRKVFCNAYHVQRAGISTMLEILGLAFRGHPHSGIDDARNIARVLAQLIADGCNIYENEKLVLNSAPRNNHNDDDDEEDENVLAAEVAVLQCDDDDNDNNNDDFGLTTNEAVSLQKKFIYCDTTATATVDVDDDVKQTASQARLVLDNDAGSQQESLTKNDFRFHQPNNDIAVADDDDAAKEANLAVDDVASFLQQKSLAEDNFHQPNSFELEFLPLSTEQVLDDTVNCAVLLNNLSA